jgi:hypothetical protein
MENVEQLLIEEEDRDLVGDQSQILKMRKQTEQMSYHMMRELRCLRD